MRGSTLWFQRLQAWYLLTFGRVTADTVAGVAARAGIDPDGLAATLAAYNRRGTGAAAGGPGGRGGPARADPAGKPPDLVLPQDQPPYSLIDFSIRPRLVYPAPVLTLGGLVVDAGTGQVLRADGTRGPRPVRGGAQRRRACAHGRTSAGCPSPTASSPAAGPEQGVQQARRPPGAQ